MPSNRLALYFLTLAVYTPYLVYSINRKHYARFPLLFATFLGMYFFNAIGSIYVYLPDLLPKATPNDYFTSSFAAVLILQDLIFYIVAIPYTLCARPVKPQMESAAPSNAMFVFALLALATAGIVFLYFMEVGVPPGLKMFGGDLNSGLAVVAYRVNNTYFLPDYFIYNLGFTIFPSLAAAFACICYLRTQATRYLVAILICMAVATFPGAKGNVLDIALLLLITRLLYRHHHPSATGKKQVLWPFGLILALSCGFVTTMYDAYYGPEMSGGRMWGAIFYRMFGGAPDGIAALLTWCNERGFLGGTTFTDIHGLLGHQVFDMNGQLHLYMWGPGGSAAYPARSEERRV